MDNKRCRKILIVDDEPHLVRIMQDRLNLLGFDTITASEGEECIKKARDEKPDLILLDIMLPGINGIEVVRQLKKDPLLNFIPIIMLTAAEDPRVASLAFQAGADDYIPKLFESILLMDKIKKLIG